MHIKIDARLRPFSHAAGTQCLLPGSVYAFTIYPQRIIVEALSSPIKLALNLTNNISGPVEKFTVQQDLERGMLSVWGESAEGYFRYEIHPSGEGFVIHVRKQPAKTLVWEFSEKCLISDGGNKIAYQSREADSIPPLPSEHLEQLHLGVNKKQDWEQVLRRCKLDEILPFWHRLGQQIAHAADCYGASLFEECRKAVAEGDKCRLSSLFINLINTGFEGMLVPQLEDTRFQGLPLKPIVAKSPLALLSLGASLIRQMFVEQQGTYVKVLPTLLPEFHCGRMINIQLTGIGTLDIEWTKKIMRRMQLKASHDGNILFQYQKELKQYRLRRKKNERGTFLPCGESFAIEKGQIYIIDNFEK